MITVLGSINVDFTGKVAEFPAPGQTITGSELEQSSGGKGANQALAGARAGAMVRLVGAVGPDASAEAALTLLDKAGVDLSHVSVGTAHTGTALILVNRSGENQISVFAGANAEVGPLHAQMAVDGSSPGSLLLLQQEIPMATCRLGLELARQKGLITIFNPAPFTDDSAALARDADYVIANEGEFEQLLPGVGSLGARLERWATEMDNVLVVTLGSKGAVLQSKEGRVDFEAPNVQVVSTVGAGDTFCGYFAAALDSGRSPAEAVAHAIIAASAACRADGAQSAMPWASDLKALGAAS